MGDQVHHPSEESLFALMHELRLKALEVFLREEWEESIKLYSDLIQLCESHDQQVQIRKSLCLAFSKRAEARCKLRDFPEALADCNRALATEGTHYKSLLCKGRILLSWNRYSDASICFKTALLDSQANADIESLNEYVEKCKKFELQSRTGVFDLSDWVVSGFRLKCPELAEYVGPVEIGKSSLSRRGLFAIKDIDMGSVMLVTKAVATERGILCGEESDEANSRLVMWKIFVDKVVDSATKCERIHQMILTLSSGADEELFEVPEMRKFKADVEDDVKGSRGRVDRNKLVSILGVNVLVEDSAAAKVLGKNSTYYGVGLWLLPSFVNHSCNPNARRVHVGDHVMLVASRNIKAGEEITFCYFDVLAPLHKRRQASKSWGFCCSCNRCDFEKGFASRNEFEEMSKQVERGGAHLVAAILRLEDEMRKRSIRGKAKGYLRASFWEAYAKMFESKLPLRRKLSPLDAVVESVIEATGSDDRILRVMISGSRKDGEAEKVARGIYGKVMRKQAMKSLLGN